MKTYQRIGYILITVSVLIFSFLIFIPYIVESKQAYIISSHHLSAQQLHKEQKNRMLVQCRQYNQTLASDHSITSLSQSQLNEYNNLLNLDGNGMMAELSIPSIRITLPVYHGTDNTTLQNGAGHCEWSDLPTGELNTHTVFTAHSGLSTARMFTDLPSMKIGDTFSITVLNREMAYTVISVLQTNPDDLSWYTRNPGSSLCTLITCVPLGINNRRLCVTAKRIKPSVNTEVFH